MGDRAVLAARGALFSTAEPDSVYTGNPAYFLKTRQMRAPV
jgi:acetyltransferase-like isoleucine patch superfamily enzyme